MLRNTDTNMMVPSKPPDVQIKTVYQRGGEALGSMRNLMKVDLLENPHAFHFEADLPGIQKEHIDIAIDGNILTVTAERKRVHNEELWKAHHRELEFGKVERSFRIPTNADPGHSRAIFEDGMLRVTIPKTIPTAVPVNDPVPANALKFREY